jgi:hypothetical protein
MGNKRDATVTQRTLNESAASTVDASENAYSEEDANDAATLLAAESLPGGDVNAEINAYAPGGVDVHNGSDVSDDEEDDEEDGDDINNFGRRGGIQPQGRAREPTVPKSPVTSVLPTTSAAPATQATTITPAASAAPQPQTPATPRKPSTVSTALPLLLELAKGKFAV